MPEYNSLYDTETLEVVEIESVKKESDASGKVGGKKPRAQTTSDSKISIADLPNLSITLSVGENSGISTVCNVGKIKADDIPDGKVISTIGSKADMSSTKLSISNQSKNVNNENDIAPLPGEVYGKDVGLRTAVREDISGTETTAFPDDLPIRDNIQIETTKQKLEAIRENSRQELARNEQLRQEAHDGYTKKIEDAQAKYFYC